MLHVVHAATTMQAVRQSASGVMLKVLVLTKEDLNGLRSAIILLPQL